MVGVYPANTLKAILDRSTRHKHTCTTHIHTNPYAYKQANVDMHTHTHTRTLACARVGGRSLGFIIGWRRPPAYTLNKIGLTPYIYIYIYIRRRPRRIPPSYIFKEMSGLAVRGGGAAGVSSFGGGV